MTCRLGLQYFPDRPAAMREMARVARPGGRVAVMVWRDIGQSPGFAALADALEGSVGQGAAAVMRAAAADPVEFPIEAHIARARSPG